MDTTTRQPSNHRIRPSKRRITSFAGLAAAILATSVLLGGCGDSTSKYAVTLTINKPADGSSIPDRMKFMKLTVLYQKEEGGSFCQITSLTFKRTRKTRSTSRSTRASSNGRGRSVWSVVRRAAAPSPSSSKDLGMQPAQTIRPTRCTDRSCRQRFHRKARSRSS